jgi:hypothetical protein
MIIIKLKGGLGNQLFQYAFGRLLSLKKGTEVRYKFSGIEEDTQRDYKLGHFNAKIKLATDEEFQRTRYPFGKISKLIELFNMKVLRRFNIGYVPRLLNKKDGYLEGFWQSYKYLEPIKKELLEEITLKDPSVIKKYDILNKIENTNSVCVNVRRGDYVNNKKYVVARWVVCKPDYYEKAFAIIREKVKNPTLFIFSDDIEWCKENIKTDMPSVFCDPAIPDYESFVIASKCKHNVITNSSFAFWIAWLNRNHDKVVITPRKWNNDGNQKNYEELLPEEWIKI